MSTNEADPVERALAHVYRATTARTVTPELGAIVSRARRRRASHAILAGVAALVAVAVGAAIGGPLGGHQTLPPVGPTVSPSPTFTVPEGMMLIDPTGHVYSGFLDSPLLGPRNADLVRDENDRDEYRVGGALAQCYGDPDDQMTVLRGIGENAAPVWVSLYVYGPNTDAEAAFAAVAADLRACLGFPDAQASPFPAQPYGDESVALTFLMPQDGAGELAGRPAHAIAVRVGRAIAVVLSTPAHGYTGVLEAATPSDLDALVRESLPRLCLYRGCTPAPGLPAQLEQISPGDHVWLVVLYVNDIDDEEARPGHGLVAAAQVGYRPVQAMQGCDVGADLAAPGREEATRYLALYFAEREEAEVAAAAVRDLGMAELGPYPQVYEVQTRCSG